MKSKLASLIVTFLLVLVGLLAVGVANKMSKTAASAQAIERPAIATTAPSGPPTADAPVAVFIGDFTQGSDEGGAGDRNWIAILSSAIQRAMPLRTVVDYSVAGSGYVVRGPSPSFAEQVPRLVMPDAKVVVISGSRNDVVAKPNEVTAAALETYKLVHTLAPRARLIVIGPTWGSNEPTPEILQTRDAVRDAAAAASADFVDPIEDKWLTNGEPGLTGPDSVQPTDLAHARIAEYLYPIVAHALLGDTT